MNGKEIIKRIGLSLINPSRLITLEYPAVPDRTYTEEDNRPHTLLCALINKNRVAYASLIENALAHKAVFHTIKNNFTWNNGYLPGLDIVMLYTFITRFKPSVYLEIGSGTSTMVAHEARKDHSLPIKIIAVDPAPRNEIGSVADIIYKQPLQQTGVKLFEDLKENDIIFFDGTHMLHPNSDVMWFFLEILPRLPKGVLVQLHDIYLPYDYPDFMCRRFYNEQYILGSLLLAAGDKYEIICPNYFISADKELSAMLLPLWDATMHKNTERHGGSFWIRIK